MHVKIGIQISLSIKLLWQISTNVFWSHFYFFFIFRLSSWNFIRFSQFSRKFNILTLAIFRHTHAQKNLNDDTNFLTLNNDYPSYYRRHVNNFYQGKKSRRFFLLRTNMRRNEKHRKKNEINFKKHGIHHFNWLLNVLNNVVKR